MEGRLLEVANLRKEDIDEMCEPSITIGIGRPIIRSEHRRDRDGFDPLPLFYEVGIVLVIQLRRQIIGLQWLCVFDRNEMKIIVIDLCGGFRRLTLDGNHRIEFAFLELLESDPLLDVDEVRLNSEPLENNNRGYEGAAV